MVRRDERNAEGGAVPANHGQIMRSPRRREGSVGDPLVLRRHRIRRRLRDGHLAVHREAQITRDGGSGCEVSRQLWLDLVRQNPGITRTRLAQLSPDSCARCGVRQSQLLREREVTRERDAVVRSRRRPICACDLRKIVDAKFMGLAGAVCRRSVQIVLTRSRNRSVGKSPSLHIHCDAAERRDKLLVCRGTWAEGHEIECGHGRWCRLSGCDGLLQRGHGFDRSRKGLSLRQIQRTILHRSRNGARPIRRDCKPRIQYKYMASHFCCRAGGLQRLARSEPEHHRVVSFASPRKSRAI